MTSPTPWLTVNEAADRARRGRRVILDALADESLRGYRPGEHGHWRIHIDDLDAWVRGERAEVQIQPITRRRAS
jgi:excisionase family DNA binding protein